MKENTKSIILRTTLHQRYYLRHSRRKTSTNSTLYRLPIIPLVTLLLHTATLLKLMVLGIAMIPSLPRKNSNIPTQITLSHQSRSIIQGPIQVNKKKKRVRNSFDRLFIQFNTVVWLLIIAKTSLEINFICMWILQ
jgi:hypothetical protein